METAAPSAFDPQEERILRRIPAEVLLGAAVLALPLVFFFDLATALIFFAGGGTAALGFVWLKQSLTRALLRGKAGALKSGILLYALRLVLICGAFFFIILLFPKKILAFGAGFSVIVLVFLVEGARALLRMKTWKA
jgi:ATP synthase I chain